MKQDWAALKMFSTSSKDCLRDLSKFGLTPQIIQSKTASTRLISTTTAFAAGVPQTAFDVGADFTAILNVTNGLTFVVYNSMNYWQSNSSRIAGTLLHEILHISSVQNYGLSDQQIADMLGVTITPTNDSAISLKPARDCFPVDK